MQAYLISKGRKLSFLIFDGRFLSHRSLAVFSTLILLVLEGGHFSLRLISIIALIRGLLAIKRYGKCRLFSLGSRFFFLVILFGSCLLLGCTLLFFLGSLRSLFRCGIRCFLGSRYSGFLEGRHLCFLGCRRGAYLSHISIFDLICHH